MYNCWPWLKLNDNNNVAENVGLMAIFVLQTDESVKWYDYNAKPILWNDKSIMYICIPDYNQSLSSIYTRNLQEWYTNLFTDNLQFLPLMWVGVWMIWVSKCQLMHWMYQACVFWDVGDLPQAYLLFSMFPPTVFGSYYENLGEVSCTGHRGIAMS